MPSPTNLFILGTPYCGSTLLGNALNAHPSMRMIGEVNRLPFYEQFEWIPEQYTKTCAVCGTHETYDCPVWGDELFSKLDGHGPAMLYDLLRGDTQDVLVDGSKNVRWLRTVLDDRGGDTRGIKVVHCVRNPVSFANSYRTHHVEPLTTGCEEWRNTFYDLFRTCSNYGVPVLTIQYEQFAFNPEESLTRVCEFVGLEYDEAMLRYWHAPIHALGGNYSAYLKFSDFRSSQVRSEWQLGIQPYQDKPFGGWSDERWLSEVYPEGLELVLNIPAIMDTAAMAGYSMAKVLERYFLKRFESEIDVDALRNGDTVVRDDLVGKIQSKFERLYCMPSYRTNKDCIEQAQTFISSEGMKPGATVIELGSGPGHSAAVFRQAGAMVAALDIARNSLNKEYREEIDVLHANVWDWESDRVYDYGFAADLMQCIPEEYVEQTLFRIATSVSKSVFFDISLRPDQFGKMINQRIHLTIKPMEWWTEKLSKFWNEVRDVRLNEVDQTFTVVVTRPKGVIELGIHRDRFASLA